MVFIQIQKASDVLTVGHRRFFCMFCLPVFRFPGSRLFLNLRFHVLGRFRQCLGIHKVKQGKLSYICYLGFRLRYGENRIIAIQILMEVRQNAYLFLISFKIKRQRRQRFIHSRKKRFPPFFMVQKTDNILPVGKQVGISLPWPYKFFRKTVVKGYNPSCHDLLLIGIHPGKIRCFEEFILFDQIADPLRCSRPF